jgi:SAM-dependent methyltransferase
MEDEQAYQTRVRSEVARYAPVENVHDLPAIYHYWSNRFLLPKLKALGFEGIRHFYESYIESCCRERASEECRVLSVGAGNCDTEIEVANALRERGIRNFFFVCIDLNAQMLERGSLSARASGLADHFQFLELDFNDATPEDRFEVVMANQSLHHCLELERLFDRIASVLDSGGFFLTSDMIGRNGHMRWPEALVHVDRLWGLLQERHKYNHQLRRLETAYDNWDCSKEGFEGIRAQDILPLLLERFHFDAFLGFANVIDVFIDRSFGHNFRVDDDWDRSFIDYVAWLDDFLIEIGAVKPAHLIGAMTVRAVDQPKIYKHLSPEFCVRWPDRPPEAIARLDELILQNG